MGMRIYGDSISGNCLKVKWTADLMGLSYDWIETSVLTGETRTEWDAVKDMIRAGVRDGVHLERGEVHAGLWCCSVALEPTRADERLAITVIRASAPSAARQTRIHRVLREEAFHTTVGLLNLR